MAAANRGIDLALLFREEQMAGSGTNHGVDLGIDGSPSERFDYRLLGTYQKGWGTYNGPFNKPHHNVSFLVEGTYKFPRHWQVRGGYAMDFGSDKMLGHNAGFQLTISKSGIF